MPDPVEPAATPAPEAIEVTPSAAPESPATPAESHQDAYAAALAAIEGTAVPAEPAPETPAEGDQEPAEGGDETPPDESATAKWAAMVEQDRKRREAELEQQRNAPAEPPATPLAALEAAGFTPEQFLNAYLGVEEPEIVEGASGAAEPAQEDPQISALKQEIEEMRNQQRDYVLQAEIAKISGVLAGNKERWPWANTHLGGEAEQLALKVAREYFINTKESIEYEEALDLVDAHIKEHFEGIQKRYAHLVNATPPKPTTGSRPDNSDPTPAPSLGASAGDTPAAALTEEDRIARALKAVGG